MTQTTTNSRIGRTSLSLLVAFAVILGIFTFDTPGAEAQTLVIGATESDSHTGVCDLPATAAGQGTVKVSSSFTGQSGQRVAYQFKIWKMNSNGRWSVYYRGAPTQDGWLYTTIGSNSHQFVSTTLNLPNRFEDGNYWNIWYVQVESYRAIGGSWQHNKVSNANHRTDYNGRRFYGGYCLT